MSGTLIIKRSSRSGWLSFISSNNAFAVAGEDACAAERYNSWGSQDSKALEMTHLESSQSLDP